MNSHDLANVRFLLSRTPEQLKEWYHSVNEEDLEYALEIMDDYEVFLKQEVMFAKIDHAISKMPVMIEAQAVIAAVQ